MKDREEQDQALHEQYQASPEFLEDALDWLHDLPFDSHSYKEVRLLDRLLEDVYPFTDDYAVKFDDWLADQEGRSQ